MLSVRRGLSIVGLVRFGTFSFMRFMRVVQPAQIEIVTAQLYTYLGTYCIKKTFTLANVAAVPAALVAAAAAAVAFGTDDDVPVANRRVPESLPAMSMVDASTKCLGA